MLQLNFGEKIEVENPKDCNQHAKTDMTVKFRTFPIFFGWNHHLMLKLKWLKITLATGLHGGNNVYATSLLFNKNIVKRRKMSENY